MSPYIYPLRDYIGYLIPNSKVRAVERAARAVPRARVHGKDRHLHDAKLGEHDLGHLVGNEGYPIYSLKERVSMGRIYGTTSSKAMAQWGTREEALLRAIAQALHRQRESFEPAQMSMVSWAFSTLSFKYDPLLCR